MKKFLLSKCFVLIMGIFLIISFAGCDKTPSSSTGSQVDLKYLETADYPLQTDQKIKWWSYRGNTVVGKYKDPAQMPWVETYKKLTGVDVEWIFPPAGQEKAQFNLLIASGDIPDIISYYWLGTAEFPGGPDKAIDDGYIAALNDLIPKYAPGFNEYLENNPMASKELKTDGGKYYYIPSYVITEDYYMNNTVGYTSGFMFRKDWLDELGLPIPETISEWYTTLKAFKNKGVENPFTIQSGYLARGLSGPWGLTLGWYHDNNKVKYGYAEPKYKEFLAEMKKWYDEGLLDANFLSIDGQSVDAKMINGKAGATFGWIGNGLIKWTRAARESNPKFLLTGVPFPVMNKGDKPVFGSRDPMVYMGGCAIGQKSENKELAMKLLDYGFTSQGGEALRYGVENETYTVNDGKYLYTDLIANNPDGLNSSEAVTAYIRNGENIPLLGGITTGARAVMETVYEFPEHKTAVEIWSNLDIDRHRLSGSMTPSDSSAAEYAKIQTSISSYANEMMFKFIVGEESLDNFDKYIAELNNRGLETMIRITQETYDRYLAR